VWDQEFLVCDARFVDGDAGFAATDRGYAPVGGGLSLLRVVTNHDPGSRPRDPVATAPDTDLMPAGARLITHGFVSNGLLLTLTAHCSLF
jgi:hypothetical protein